MSGIIDVMAQKLAAFLKIRSPINISSILLNHCISMSISSSRNIDRKKSTIIIIKIKLNCKTCWLIRQKETSTLICFLVTPKLLPVKYFTLKSTFEYS